MFMVLMTWQQFHTQVVQFPSIKTPSTGSGIMVDFALTSAAKCGSKEQTKDITISQRNWSQQITCRRHSVETQSSQDYHESPSRNVSFCNITHNKLPKVMITYGKRIRNWCKTSTNFVFLFKRFVSNFPSKYVRNWDQRNCFLSLWPLLIFIK